MRRKVIRIRSVKMGCSSKTLSDAGLLPDYYSRLQDPRKEIAAGYGPARRTGRRTGDRGTAFHRAALLVVPRMARQETEICLHTRLMLHSGHAEVGTEQIQAVEKHNTMSTHIGCNGPS